MTRNNCIVLALITLFVLITLAYSMVIPVFNAPDEPFHFEYIRFLAEKKRLPNQTIEELSIATEGFNPPLYYGINAVVLGLVSPDNAAEIRLHTQKDIARFFRYPYLGFRSDIYPPLNPKYIKWGKGRERNMFLTLKEDKFPFSGSIRTIHILRIISVLLGALTVWFIYKTALTFLPGNENIALLAAALCAFNPQFNFLSGSINNDNLVILCATISLWLLSRLLIDGQEGQRRRVIVLLGIFAGLGLITKINIASVIVTAIIGIIYSGVTQGSPQSLPQGSLKGSPQGSHGCRNILTHLSLFLGILAAIAGWYFVRGIFLYGANDPLGWHLRALQNPGLVLPPQYRGFAFKQVFFLGLFTSFWGQFDWLTIFLSRWAYWFYGAITVFGIVGLAALLLGGAHQRRVKVCAILFLAAVLISIANLIILNFTFLSTQARLIFPVMSCICLFMGIGIYTLFKLLSRLLKWKEGFFVYGLILILLMMDLYALIGVIYPVYR